MTQQPFGGFPPQQQYGFPNQPPAQSKDSGLAIAALIFSLFGLIGLVSVIPGIVLGHVAFAKARRGEAGGKGMALAAFIVGYLMIILYAIAIPVVLSIAAKHGAFR
ncbi:DUF4190 domain-containing protein [Amycolatopsis sp. BJA-103]|uniref:DUF4190 domain-containing protein n=1 Tax=Amycolatopsis sp. BJA-103 TaxID=1911175 RepID=UPI000C78D8F1|nr:DUF4190 domain-containing protein [Amycolatopsis sp. BJA-103]AUI63638.1 hypothetical protein BKN51_39435 [Amycolatopsis sp. BJA-103]PNE19482.1 hypothetical protein B1H26_17150 [Amycolatopsis sp. BJA-103]